MSLLFASSVPDAEGPAAALASAERSIEPETATRQRQIDDEIRALLWALRIGDTDATIPGCGRVIRLARARGLVEGAGPPFSPLVPTPAGLAFLGAA